MARPPPSPPPPHILSRVFADMTFETTLFWGLFLGTLIASTIYVAVLVAQRARPGRIRPQRRALTTAVLGFGLSALFLLLAYLFRG